MNKTYFALLIAIVILGMATTLVWRNAGDKQTEQLSDATTPLNSSVGLDDVADDGANANPNSNTPNVEISTLPNNDWTTYEIDDGSFYRQGEDGAQREIALPFSLDEYGYERTPYGVLFWKFGPRSEAVVNGFNEPIAYRGGADPAFQWYDFSSQQFVTLPEYQLRKEDQQFEQVFATHASTSEKKLLIEIGEYDTESPEFVPGLGVSQPVRTHGLVYDIEQNIFENDDPLVTYLEILESPTTRYYGMAWDSIAAKAVAVRVGEGCGRLNHLIFVDLQQNRKTVIGGEGSFEFFNAPCTPKNGASPDGKWFVLYGIQENDEFVVLLFDINGVQLRKKIIPATDRFVISSWNQSKEYPVITFSDRDQNSTQKLNVDFNE